MSKKKAAVDQPELAAAAKPDDAPPAAVSPARRATVLVPFDGCRDGELHPRKFAEGAEIEGDLAAAMIAAGMAKPLAG